MPPLYREERHSILFMEEVSAPSLQRRETLSPRHREGVHREGVCLLAIQKRGTLPSSYIRKASASSMHRRGTRSLLYRYGACLLSSENIYICIYVYIYIEREGCVYIYIYRERERQRERARERDSTLFIQKVSTSSL